MGAQKWVDINKFDNISSTVWVILLT
jgi:hypothetical protein